MSVQIIQGDVREMLATLDADSIQTCVTSPPYYALRDYGVDGQIGLEQTPAEFIAALVGVFDEVKRVLRPDGVCFVNIGDSYGGSYKGNVPGPNSQVQHHWRGSGEQLDRTPGRAKDLLLIPERLAIAMQDRGWYVRSRIAWCKLSAMPESVRDRPTSAWEHIWMFTKSARYFWDADAVRQPQTGGTHSRGKGAQGAPKITVPGQGIKNNASFQAAMVHDAPPDGLANLRNYWLLGPEPSREEHYAAFPTEIPKRCILAGTSERGQCPACGSPWVRVVERTPMVIERSDWANGSGNRTAPSGTMVPAPSSLTTGWQPSCRCDAGEPVPQVVLDPFLGTGTTALVADRLGRHAVGVELNPKYVEIAKRRISGDAPMFADVQVG